MSVITYTLTSGNVLAIAPEVTFGNAITIGVLAVFWGLSIAYLLMEVIKPHV
jgi:hypothetical protein